MKDGIYTSITSDEYHSLDMNLISSSFIKSVLKDPRFAWMEKVNFSDKEESSSMKTGSLIHEMLLEPEKYYNRNVVDKRKKENKDIPDNYIISQKDKDLCNIIEKVLNFDCYKPVNDFLDKSKKEVTIISNGKKARIDILSNVKKNNENITIIADCKTHSKNFPFGDDFHLDIRTKYYLEEYNYLLQLAFYKNIFLEAMQRVLNNEIESEIDISEYSDIVITQLMMIQTVAPYSISMINVSDTYLDKEIDKINSAIQIIKDQKEKHQGFSYPWDSNYPMYIEYVE